MSLQRVLNRKAGRREHDLPRAFLLAAPLRFNCGDSSGHRKYECSGLGYRGWQLGRGRERGRWDSGCALKVAPVRLADGFGRACEGRREIKTVATERGEQLDTGVTMN